MDLSNLLLFFVDLHVWISAKKYVLQWAFVSKIAEDATLLFSFNLDFVLAQFGGAPVVYCTVLLYG